MPEGRSLRLCLFGAAGDTGNLGVSALLHSSLGAVFDRAPGAHVTVFDNGWDMRPALARAEHGQVGYTLRGARYSQRYYRRESLANIRVSSWLGGLGNPASHAIGRADAILDVSGGDSFSDIYGRKRFQSTVIPKRIALGRHRPLILLPQTYGPFGSTRARRVATDITRRAVMAWARDPASFDALKDLVGDDFDPSRHLAGVDLAFLLRPLPLEPQVLDDVEVAGEDGVPLAGINVSGLLYNDPGATARFGLTVDYRTLMRRLVEEVLKREARIVLVPHVRSKVDYESDVVASLSLIESLPRSQGRDVTVMATCHEPGQVKTLMGKLEWFCGTRMHSAIAALGMGVPTAALAYSIKTRGVFATCGQEAHVADARRLSEDEILDIVLRSWDERDKIRAELVDAVPEVIDRAGAQMDVVMERVALIAGQREAACPSHSPQDD